ncbi:MAG: OmpA family protein [Phycisphaerae bacterium]
MRAAKLALGGMGILFLAGLVGCADDPKDLQIQALQDKLARLEAERNDLNGRLQAALGDADASRQRALQLQQMYDDLNAAAARSKPTQVGDFTEQGPYAWTNIAEDILFDSGEAVLKPSGKAKLADVARQIRERYGDRNVWVIGHTDTDPIRRTAGQHKDNLDLSLKRGYAVTREFYSLGLDPSKVVAGGQGEFAPRAPNDSRGNKAMNRRVQILAVKPPQFDMGGASSSARPAADTSMRVQQ